MKTHSGFLLALGISLIAACGGKTTGADIPGGGGGNGSADGGRGGGGGNSDGGGGLADGGGIDEVPIAHRPVAVACGASPVPQDPDIAHTQFASNATFECKTNADCTAQAGGRCSIYACGNEGGPACEPQGTRCDYDACATDFDCTSGAVCDCASGEGGTNRCITGGCRIDADCGSNGYCSPSLDTCDSNINEYECHSTSDECLNDSDCTSSQAGAGCEYDGTKFSCQLRVCASAASNGN